MHEIVYLNCALINEDVRVSDHRVMNTTCAIVKVN